MGSRGRPPDLWTNEQQRPTTPDSTAAWNTFKFGAVTAGIFGAGFLPWKGGNVWDKYLKGIRTAEEYSPGGILRTLQISNFLSPLSSTVRNGSVFITPELLGNNATYQRYLSNLIGQSGTTYGRLGLEGVTFRNGKLFWGQGEEVALKHASAFLGQEFGAQRAGAAYARVLNTPGRIPFEKFFSKLHPSEGVVNPALGGMAAQIIGGQTRGEAAYRMAAAFGTEQVGRFNRLLGTPFENEFLKKTLGRALKFDVGQTGGLRMLGKLGMKYGPALGGIALGYQSLDYLMKRSSLLDGTIFEEGLTTGIATMGIKSNLALSRVADMTGMHAYREKQEQIAPGSTDLQKLAAFPIMGSMFMGFSAYAMKVYDMFKMQRTMQGPWGGRMPAALAREVVEREMKEWGGKSALSRAGKWISSKLPGNMGPIGVASLAGAAIGAAAILPFLPGALVPGKRPDELQALYSGRQDVAVKKGRWWSFGRTPYEGDRTMYFRPHWYARMRMNAQEKGVWGDDDTTPLEKWYKREFTYDLEQKHYYDRPYPVTSLPFEDVPLVGPLLANTIGKMIKPPKLMHTDEWMGSGGATKSDYPRFGERIATEMGQVPGGAPISPYSPTQAFGEQTYRMTEMVGLPGFLESTLKEKLTGSQDWFDQYKQLESARRIDSMERWYWDQELGDMFMTNEGLRRLYPHRRRQIDLYNPIRNTMPEWMPGPGEKSPDFLHGDPYTKVQEGELRLPGKGYEARYPELAGVDPEDYPDLHKFKILADVAPYSDSFGVSLGNIRKRRGTKDWTAEEEQTYLTTIDQIKQRKTGKTFQEYQYLSPMGEIMKGSGAQDSSDLMAAINRSKAANVQKPGVFTRMFGGYWELLSHNAETSFDMLTPLSPGAKLVHQRTAIESYERERVYGSQAGFWQRPIHDFIQPFIRSTAHSVGWNGVPEELQERRKLEEFFDILKYTKAQRLSNMAGSQGDEQAVSAFERQKDQTLFGINPFTRSFGNLMRALPKPDRDYFASFEKAQTEDERRAILGMVPENEKALYTARWKLVQADEVRRAQKAGILSDDQMADADIAMDNFYREAENEGYPTSQKLFAEYTATRQKGENYADWYRRCYLLPNVKVPGPDWVGWHPSVDLDDVKLKLVQTLGEDMHDYDLWESRAKQLPYKPYINDEAIQPLMDKDELTKEQMRSRIKSVLAYEGLEGDAFLTSSRGPNKRNEVNVEVETDRSSEMKSMLQKMV